MVNKAFKYQDENIKWTIKIQTWSQRLIFIYDGLLHAKVSITFYYIYGISLKSSTIEEEIQFIGRYAKPQKVCVYFSISYSYDAGEKVLSW